MRRRWSIVAAGFLAAALTGCVQIPDGGPVRTADNAGDGTVGSEQVFVPRGPQDRESGPDIVTHFFEAMTASPMSATVAREFLTRSAGDSWSPEDGYLVYERMDPPVGIGNLKVTLSGVNLFDSRGRWVGTPPGGTRVLDIAMDVENGQQWRIASVPDRLMVTDNWFETNTLPMSIYYFDPEGRILVPEPVYVPQGDQMPTLLMRALIESPGDQRIERSFVPQGTDLAGPVTVGPDGTADIPLTGDLANVPPDTLAKMEVQIAWSLRQVPSISSVRIIVDGQPLPHPSGGTKFSVDTGASYDPAGIFARGELYGLSGGLAVRVLDGEAQTLLVGPFGQQPYGLTDVSVDLNGGLIAGVTRDRQRIILSSVTGSDGLAPRTILSGGVDILHPAWDFAGRMWVVDRRPGGAVVSMIKDGRITPVDVPGITGEDVINFLVSRDGTRIVAAIRQGPSDRIVMSRTYTTGPRSTLRGTIAQTIVRGEVEGGGEMLRIRDIGWRSPTEVYYLKAVAGRQSELRSTVVDGSPSQFDPEAISGIFGALTARLISSPRAEEPVYLQKPGGTFDPIVPGAPQVAAEATTLHYVG